MKQTTNSHNVEQICIALERLAADRTQLIETCRSLNQLDYRLRSQMEALEQDLMDALNVDDSESLDIQDIGSACHTPES